MGKIDSKERIIRLMNQYQNLIFSICLKLTGDYFIAEDLTQETFISAYHHLDKTRPGEEKAWLCRIASNKSIDYVRKVERKVEPVTEEELHNIAMPMDTEPLRQTLNSELMEELRACCRNLSPPYREIAIAHFLEGKTAREIAEETKASIHTVKSQIYRAREMLKKSYRKELLQE